MFSRYRVPIALTSTGTVLLTLGLVVPLTVAATRGVQAQAPTASATSLPDIPHYVAPQGAPAGDIRRDPFVPDNATPVPNLPDAAAAGGQPAAAPLPSYATPVRGTAGVPALPPNFGANGTRLAPAGQLRAPAAPTAVAPEAPPDDAIVAVVTGTSGNYALITDGGRTRIVKRGDSAFGRRIVGVSFTSGVAFADGSHLAIPVSAQ